VSYVFDNSPLSALFRNYYRKTFPSLWQRFDQLVGSRAWQTTKTRSQARRCNCRRSCASSNGFVKRFTLRKPNLEAYGYDIRNLLILACTEVESHWRAVLKANGVSKDRWSTRDYVGLKDAMKLNEFEVSFPDYPWIKPIAPFKSWDEGRPTLTLPWYDAYNAAKHDRESELKSATLRFVLNAVAACAIMTVAQFGEVFGFDLGTTGRPRTFFWIRSGPVWDLADHYAEAFESGNGEWTPVNYPFVADGRSSRGDA
jgi:hypothetical protein